MNEFRPYSHKLIAGIYMTGRLVVAKNTERKSFS